MEHKVFEIFTYISIYKIAQIKLLNCTRKKVDVGKLTNYFTYINSREETQFQLEENNSYMRVIIKVTKNY